MSSSSSKRIRKTNSTSKENTFKETPCSIIRYILRYLSGIFICKSIVLLNKTFCKYIINIDVEKNLTLVKDIISQNYGHFDLIYGGKFNFYEIVCIKVNMSGSKLIYHSYNLFKIWKVFDRKSNFCQRLKKYRTSMFKIQKRFFFFSEYP